MATPNDWAYGYLSQARADLAACVDCGVSSVRAMLLQMALEKLAKAALLRSGGMTPAQAQKTHLAAIPLMQGLDRRRCKQLGWNHNTVRGRLASMVSELERAQPQLAQKGPCLEYPWLGPAGEVKWPEADLPIVSRFRAKSPDAMLLMNFALDLHARFDRVFQ